MISSEQTQALRKQHYQATLVSKRMIHEELAILRVRPDVPLHAHRAGQYTTLGLGMWEPRHPLAVPETIKPGNDLFIVWNRGWQRLLTRPDLSLIPQSDLVAVKLRWTFRF